MCPPRMISRRFACSCRPAASHSAPLVADARSRLGCAISAGWGMTENGLATCNGLSDPEDKIVETDGIPLRVCRARARRRRRYVPAGVEGDLIVTGPAQFVGYFERPEFTREAHTSDGWFKTGDPATLDRDGYLAITGRSKDLIIRGGENIPVAEVENLLFAHPRSPVSRSSRCRIHGCRSAACAFVVPRPGESVTLDELVAYLETKQLEEEVPGAPRVSPNSR